ncbi:NUDIX domain-containing protein [Cohnella endophytica]|uniref:NUDIX domain-containing protein n=1 Tax=Cohnella endophytica TaxID=2419778 RepID=A0A494XRG1_9BACL|nr:NUDIX domain-containing protein [Cohnella endophytica]RKP50103.1 NUDIX domain-containing protein [Cohnella endophytica]
MAEMFDVYDEKGNWTGIAERSEVHAKGLWHHTVHCWLVRKVDGRAKVLFQQRSEGKDTNPSCFDITAAGHLEAGETPNAVLRELEEELGVRVGFEQLAEYGLVKEYLAGVVGGVDFIDAEVSHVYGLVTELGWTDFRLQEEEVAGLYEADAEELIALMEERLDKLNATGIELRQGTLQPAEKVVERNSFVERDYGYYVSVFGFLMGLVRED